MANTLKFGNGEWATKKGSTLAYNSENGNFKPLPFTFDRSTSATRVNKEGLIEVVSNNEPRIDFLNDSKGALKLEPLRSNLITYSSDFSDAPWYKSSATSVLSDIKSPDGSLSSYEVEGLDGGAGVFHFITVSTNTEYTFSFYARRSDLTNAYYRVYSNTNGTNIVTPTSYYDEINSDEWKRVSVTFNSGTSTSIRVYICSIVGGAIVWGAQLEQASYPTSYIPTQGSIGTRVDEDMTLILPDNASFNSSNGFSVISKFGIGNAGSGTSAPFIYFNDDTGNTYMGFGSNSTNLRCRLNLSGTAYLNTQANAPRTQENSLFISCDANGWSQGANGVTNDTGNNDASVYDKLSNIIYVSSELYGIIRIKELSVYNTRLTNAELQALTKI